MREASHYSLSYRQRYSHELRDAGRCRGRDMYRDRSIDGAIRIFTRGDRAPALPFYADGVGLLLVIAALIARSGIVSRIHTLFSPDLMP